jgi:hypothetical protein
MEWAALDLFAALLSNRSLRRQRSPNKDKRKRERARKWCKREGERERESLGKGESVGGIDR